MKKLFVLGLVLIIVGCSVFRRYEEAFDYVFDVPDLGLETVEDVCVWTADFLRYVDDDVHEVSEYWQQPYQTYTWRSGDCEDFAILAMYLIYRDTGLIPGLVVGTGPSGQHGWVVVMGEHWEPQIGMQVDYRDMFPLQIVLPYEEVLWRAVNRHKKLEVTND